MTLYHTLRRVALLLGGVLMAGPALWAQSELSLQQCREMALQHNRQLARARQHEAYAAHSARSYKALFFPEFKASGMGFYSTGKGALRVPGGNLPVFVPTPSGQFVPNGSVAYFPGLELDYKMNFIYTAGISVTQPLYMGGKIRSAYRMAKLGSEVAQLGIHLSETEVVLATEQAYAGAVKAQEMQIVAQHYVATLEELERNVQSAVKHGMKTNNDRLKVQVKLNEARLMQQKANNARRLAVMNLCHHIGRGLTDSISVSAEFPTVPSSLTDASLVARPEMAMLDKQVELNRQQLSMVRSERLPQVALRASYDYANGLKVAGSKFFDSGSFSAMLNVSIPLFHFGERKHKVAAARAKLEESLTEQQDKQELMMLELTQAALNVSEARTACELAETALTQAEENRRLSAHQFAQGMETLSDHLEAQLLWQQAWQAKVEAHFNLYLQYVAYRKANGTLCADR